MLIKYCYNSKEFEFDIEFNMHDFAIQLEIDDHLYNDIFSVIDLKEQNSFFDDMDFIKDIMLKCFYKEDNCSLEIMETKCITLTLVLILV
jgi:hypothetical protein